MRTRLHVVDRCAGGYQYGTLRGGRRRWCDVADVRAAAMKFHFIPMRMLRRATQLHAKTYIFSQHAYIIIASAISVLRCAETLIRFRLILLIRFSDSVRRSYDLTSLTMSVVAS